MKGILRTIGMYALALFLLPKVLPGFVVTGGMTTYVVGGCVLSIMSFIVKPILNIISFPLNILTLGLFSALSNLLILYLLTIMVPNIVIKPFTFPGISLFGFTIPKADLSQFFAFVVAAFVLSGIIAVIDWLNS